MKASVLPLLTVVLAPFALHAAIPERPLRQAQDRPNIVVILSDDAGFEEFGIYKVKQGEPSNTPNIDKLGEQGVAFAHCWGQAICGPSRSMFITGNYPTHNGAYDNKLFFMPNGQSDKAAHKASMPHFTQIAQAAGYKVAVSGKWHNPAGYMLPDESKELGVDTYRIWDASAETFEKRLGHKLIPDDTWEIAAISGLPKISRYWKPGIIQDDVVIPTTMDHYGPDMYNDFVLEFMEAQTKAEQPFLVYYTQTLPHGAHCPTPDLVAQGMEATNLNSKKGTPEGAKMFHAQVNYADKLVGKVVAKINALGIADNTVIIYASDNGTTSSSKGKAVEFGVHVPLIIAGAGIQQRGMTRELTDFTDICPTIMDLIGGTLPEGQSVDGISLVPFLSGESNHTKDAIYAFPGPSRLVRTKDFMLEAVSELYDTPQGRFYQTNDSWDGRGYENVTHNPEFAEQRKRFDDYMAAYPSVLPTSWDDPIWQQPKMQKSTNFFNNPKRKAAHHRLPKDYEFYDPSF